MIRGGSARAATVRSAPQIEGDPGHEPEEARIAGRSVMNDTAPGVRRHHHLVWRGPVWLNANWLLWRGLRLHGRTALADEIANSILALVGRSGFREYFEPFDGSGHGSDDFSWSASLAIDFIRSAT